MPTEAATVVELDAGRHPECLRVLNDGFATEVSEFGITAENTPTNPAFWSPADLQRVVARGIRVFAVEHAGRIVGCAFLAGSPSKPDRRVLRHLAVLPEARHRGYGEALVAAAARQASAEGAVALRVGIVAANRRLAEWYHRLGFVTVEADVRYPGLVFAVDHLELPLTSA